MSVLFSQNILLIIYNLFFLLFPVPVNVRIKPLVLGSRVNGSTHRHLRNIDSLSFVMCPLLAPVLIVNRLLFLFLFLLLRPFTELLKQTRYAVCAVKQSLLLRCLWFYYRAATAGHLCITGPTMLSMMTLRGMYYKTFNGHKLS